MIESKTIYRCDRCHGEVTTAFNEWTRLIIGQPYLDVPRHATRALDFCPRCMVQFEQWLVTEPES